MYRLLIADDEAWIRDRLLNTMDWESMAITQVDVACDGKEALELILKEEHDIVLTDIRMPRMSGLELLDAIKREHLKAKVIIMSGYNDFDYAQKAVQLGAFDYLLKPVDDESLKIVIKKCVAEWQEDERKDLAFYNLKEKLAKNKPILKERFYYNLLSGNVEEDVFLDEIEFFNIPNEGYQHVCLAMQPEKEPFARKDAFLFQTSVKNVAQEFLNLAGEGQAVALDFGGFACVLSSCHENILQQTQTAADKMEEVVFKLFDIKIAVGIGGIKNNLMDISTSFWDARQALLTSSYSKNSGDRMNISKISKDTQNALDYNSQKKVLIYAIEYAEKEEVEQAFHSFIKKVRKAELTVTELRSMYLDIMFSVFRIEVEKGKRELEMSALDFEMFEQLSTIEGLEDFEQVLHDSLIKIVRDEEWEGEQQPRNTVQMALDYIDENYQEAISLSDVAGLAYMNISYFCRIFKQDVGMSFSQYLMRYRMDKAVELMSDPSFKIYEISERVGYQDAQYFSKIFKRIKGMSPAQYRELRTELK